MDDAATEAALAATPDHPRLRSVRLAAFAERREQDIDRVPLDDEP